jgi:phage shock protein A
MSEPISIGLVSRGYDKHGPKFLEQDINISVAKMINTQTYFERKAKKMSTDLDKAQTHVEDALNRFGKSLNNLQSLEETFVNKSKKVSSAVKDSEEKLLQGLARIEKAANFERLSRYVELLERASSAMNQLAELQKDGKLDKIASAIR